MKSIMIAVLAAVLAMPAVAEEKAAAPAKSSWTSFFKNLKSSLSNSAVSGQQKKGRNAAAVAAVRGKKQKDIADPNEPGLRGDAKSRKVQKEMELDAKFDKAVNSIIDGKPEDGLKQLEALKEANPKYKTEDLDKAIEGAKAMIAEKGNAAPAAKE